MRECYYSLRFDMFSVKAAVDLRFCAQLNYNSICPLKPNVGAGFGDVLRVCRTPNPSGRDLSAVVFRSNYESACTWDIYCLLNVDEMVDRHRKQRWQKTITSMIFTFACCE
jgi:hypothetical protein